MLNKKIINKQYIWSALTYKNFLRIMYLMMLISNLISYLRNLKKSWTENDANLTALYRYQYTVQINLTLIKVLYYYYNLKLVKTT